MGNFSHERRQAADSYRAHPPPAFHYILLFSALQTTLIRQIFSPFAEAGQTQQHRGILSSLGNHMQLIYLKFFNVEKTWSKERQVCKKKPSERGRLRGEYLHSRSQKQPPLRGLSCCRKADNTGMLIITFYTAQITWKAIFCSKWLIPLISLQPILTMWKHLLQ